MLNFYTRISILLFSVLTTACMDQAQPEVAYTNIAGDTIIFEDNYTVLVSGDSFTKVKDCFPSGGCLQFDDTVIQLPPTKILNKVRSQGAGRYENVRTPGKFQEIEYTKLSMFGNDVKGFSIKTYTKLNNNMRKLSNVYFYSFDKGVVAFKYRFRHIDIVNNVDALNEEIFFISGNKGILAMD